MATKLFLRNTQDNGIGATYYDMLIGAGSSTDTAVVNDAASGTEIQWTKTAGGAIAQWISGRVPSGGFTLTTCDISIWAQESNMNANCGGRFRVFKRAANGTETELGGGPFNDGVEFGTSAAEMTWIGNVTDTAFAEDDRILLKVYITNVGTMGSGHTCTLTFNGADAATGDSFFNINETVTFKLEQITGTGALEAQDSDITGTGTSSSSGTGALVAQASDITGTAASESSGTGDLEAGASTIVGAGEVTGSGGASGSGALVAQAADINGTGLSSSQGAGALQAQNSTIVGVAVSGSSGAGALVAQDSDLSGVAVSGSTGTGALEADPSTIVGRESPTVFGREHITLEDLILPFGAMPL